MFVTPEIDDCGQARTRQFAGVVEGQELARACSPGCVEQLLDLELWVNDLLGNTPPAFDVLYWNNDTTRLPARLHGDFLDLLTTNPFVNPGRVVLCGTPLDMRRLDMDTYVFAGLSDHHRGRAATTRRSRGPRSTVRALEQRSHPGLAQSARQPQGVGLGRPRTGRNAGRVELGQPGNTAEAGEHWLEWIEARSARTGSSAGGAGRRAKPARTGPWWNL